MDWLEAQAYESLGDEDKLARKRFALTPFHPNAEMPDVYRLHLLMLETGLPLVDGGALDQPFAMRRELQAVRNGIADFEVEEHNREARISELQSGNAPRSAGEEPIRLT